MMNTKPYIPNELPLNNLDYERLFHLVADANSAISEYNGLLYGITSPNIILAPLTAKEAVLSSKIEGTQATIDEVLEHEAGLLKDGEKAKDIKEILNYHDALLQASEHLKKYPITLNLILEMHKILLNSVRGQNKSSGSFRKDQNWGLVLMDVL